jgi:hypothetical protein
MLSRCIGSVLNGGAAVLYPDEKLSALVEPLLKTLREARPRRFASFSQWPASRCARSSMSWPDA